MPAPAVYVFAVVGGVAAVIAFKEFVYEPHIVPALQNWQAQLEARRRQRRGPVSVAVSDNSNDHPGSGTELRSLRPKRSGPDMGDEEQGRAPHELEQMVAKEVDEWRSGVERSQTAGLRQRRNTQSGSALEESNTFLPYSPMSPTHIVFDFSAETSPTSSHPSSSDSAAIRVAGPPSSIPDSPMSSVRPSDSVSVVGQATPQMSPQVQPPSLSFTYDARALSLSPPIVVSPALPTPTPSSPATSLTEFVVRPSHPQGLGLEFFSDSSRPDTPFSSLSASSSTAAPRNLQSSRNLTLAIPGPHLHVRSSSGTSDTDHFVSAISQSASHAASEIDFQSAIGGDEDFYLMSPSTESNPSSAVGDDFDLGDNDDSDGEGWASVSQRRH